MARVAIDWTAGYTSIRTPFDLPEILSHADTVIILAALKDKPIGERVEVEVEFSIGVLDSEIPERRPVRVHWVPGPDSGH